MLYHTFYEHRQVISVRRKSWENFGLAFRQVLNHSQGILLKKILHIFDGRWAISTRKISKIDFMCRLFKMIMTKIIDVIPRGKIAFKRRALFLTHHSLLK